MQSQKLQKAAREEARNRGEEAMDAEHRLREIEVCRGRGMIRDDVINFCLFV